MELLSMELTALVDLPFEDENFVGVLKVLWFGF